MVPVPGPIQPHWFDMWVNAPFELHIPYPILQSFSRSSWPLLYVPFPVLLPNQRSDRDPYFVYHKSS